LPFPGRLVATDFAASVGFLENIQRRFLFRAGFGFALGRGFAEQILQQGDYHQKWNEPDRDPPPLPNNMPPIPSNIQARLQGPYMSYLTGARRKSLNWPTCHIPLISYLLTQL
jgi:hypothetical protein